MTERQLETLKDIKRQLDDFMKELRPSAMYYGIGDSLDKATGLLSKAIREAGERVEKRYVAEFYDRNTRETIEIAFWSNKRAGSYANRLDAEFAMHSEFRKQNRPITDIRFENAYRGKEA